MYDTKIIFCSCRKCIEYRKLNAEVILLKCGQCANPRHYEDKILHKTGHLHNKSVKMVNIPLTA